MEFEDSRSHSNSLESEIVEKMLKLMDKYQISITSVAHKIGISPSRLNNYFRKPLPKSDQVKSLINQAEKGLNEVIIDKQKKHGLSHTHFRISSRIRRKKYGK